MSGTGHLDINPADRARLLASATAYAAGRRTYVVGAVSDVVAANAGRLDAAVRETLADAIRPAADAGDSIDAPAWTRALAALETAAPDDLDGLDGNAVDLRILLHCAFRHDMGGGAGLWTRLLEDPTCLTGNGAPSPRVTCTRPDTRPKTHPSRPSSTWSHWGTPTTPRGVKST